MLVLSRKCSERIHIGDDIVLTVIRTGKGRVRLGIEAPKDVRILRDELYNRSTSSGLTVSELQQEIHLPTQGW
jgi:carbon storage regulator